MPGTIDEPPLDELRQRVRWLEQRATELESRVLQSFPERARRRFFRLLAPPLGSLRQYAPRPLRVPPSYGEARPPDPAPCIAVVTPSLDQARFLPQTIASVMGQGYPRLEYTVQDGGSQDGTRKVLEQAAEADPRLTWDSRPDSGHAQAINRAFGRTRGEIMAWLNADDLLLPGTLAYVAGYLSAHPEVEVVYGHRVVVDEEGRDVGRWIVPPHDGAALTWGDYVPQETLFWRRRTWDRVGGSLDETFQFAADWDLLLRFRAHGAVFARLPRFLGAFRAHPQQKTQREMGSVGHDEIRRLHAREHGRLVRGDEIARGLGRYLDRAAVLRCLYGWGLLRF